MRVLLTASGDRVNLAASRAYTVGRDPDCDIVVHDLACSRRHARITVAADGKSVHVEDLGSSNGTFVNEQQIPERTLLKLGARVRIGASVYVLRPAGMRLSRNLDLMEAGTLNIDTDSMRDFVAEMGDEDDE